MTTEPDPVDSYEGWYIRAQKRCPYCDGTREDPKKRGQFRYGDRRGMCLPCAGTGVVDRTIPLAELRK